MKGRLRAKLLKVLSTGRKREEKKGVKLKNTIKLTWQESTFLADIIIKSDY